MKAFATLYRDLDDTTSTLRKVEALVRYFRSVAPEDGAWAVYLLSGKKLKRVLQRKHLLEAVQQKKPYPLWLLEECLTEAGDSSEAIALLAVSPDQDEPRSDVALHTWMGGRIGALSKMDEATRNETLWGWWQGLSYREAFLLNKIIMGGFRVGVAEKLVAQAFAKISGRAVGDVLHDLAGNWTPDAAHYASLMHSGARDRNVSTPYPFALAHPLTDDVAELGEPGEWQAEWKWDGMRAQLIKRQDTVFLWSRGQELISAQFPEITMWGASLPDGTVVDGELLVQTDAAPEGFAALQKRIGRVGPKGKILETHPVRFVGYDLLELAGQDLRQETMATRREKLENLWSALAAPWPLSSLVSFASWDELKKLRDESRERRVEGFMLKRKTSPYAAGRVRGDWWKWKVDPYQIDAVLLYAQAGRGIRASLYTDYTFGLWDQGQLVPIAKAYSGLTKEEIGQLDKWIKANTIQKFGPVRSVPAHFVFELAFEGLQPSTRHKSGWALRFPRISRWRVDKSPEQADSVKVLEELHHAADA